MCPHSNAVMWSRCGRHSTYHVCLVTKAEEANSQLRSRFKLDQKPLRLLEKEASNSTTANAMDVLAGLLAAKAEQEDKLDEARGSKSDGSFVARHLRRAGLSKAQVLSSLASLADWVTDCSYY